VDRKDKLLVVKWESLCKHVGHKKVDKNIGIGVKKRDWYYSKDSRHANNKKLLVFHVVNLLLPKLQMQWHNLPPSCICYSKGVQCWNMKH
jgi:hypothetical protein